jgi:signal transduction histidine kinase/ligand-binding sensor domain-containing protein/CheY-like chemotaxis protein
MALMLWVRAGALQATAIEPLPPPVFRVLGTEQGLPSRQIQALVEDADGRIWIGTANGLARYDGHSVVAYPARMEQANALASTSVEALAVDARQQLWIATEGGKLARWRALGDDFERFDLASMVHAEQLEAWALATHEQRLWVGTYGAGLLQLDLDGRVQRQYQIPAQLGSPHVLELLAAPDGCLYVVTMDRDLLRFDPDQERFQSLLAGQVGSRAYGLALRGNAVWFSTRDGRLCEYAASTGMDCPPLPQLALPGRARMLLPDRRGDWIGGMGELLRIVDGSAQRVGFQPGAIGGVPQQALAVALSDHDSGLWFGSEGGGLLYLSADADRFRVWQPDLVGRKGLRDGRVRGVAVDARGTVWIASMNSGLHRLTHADGKIEAVTLPTGESDRVWAVLADRGELWVGHQDGLLRLRSDGLGSLVPAQRWSAAQLVGAIVDLLAQDSRGQIWAASMGAGINQIDPLTNQVRQHPFGVRGLAGTEVQQISVGIDDRVWVATDRGLVQFDEHCDCWRALIADSRVDAFGIDPEQRIYAFVDGTLVRYLWRDGLFRDEQLAPRGFAEFQTVGGLAFAAGALWIAGPQGLYRFLPGDGRLESYDGHDGLPTREFSDRPIYTDPQGRLWLGSEDGLIWVDPALALPDPAIPRLRFEQRAVDGPEGLRDLGRSDGAILRPDDGELRVAVRMNSLTRAHAQRFSFRVEGWDADWSSPSAWPERRIGVLPAGPYTLEVRAWDGYGRAAANVLSWPFEVLPPWWRSSTAMGGYLLLGITLLALVERWRQRRRQAEALWAETRRQAQWAERLAAEKTALVAELSHEIRNPLNGVLGMSRLLSEEALAPAGRRYLAMLTDAGQQLAQLLDDMLDWSRLEARAAALPLQAECLGAVLAPVLNRYSQLASQRGLSFAVNIDPGISVMVDAQRLRQIVENLLSNALKFTLQGWIRVRALVTVIGVDLRVEDSGPGMSPTQLERLFLPFERFGDERAAPGTGLGLAISRSLAERMCATLQVESQPGTGSCFVLGLSAASAEPEKPPAALSTLVVAPPELTGARVMLVDDDATNREVLSAELRRLGIEPKVEADALGALVALHADAFDLALVDWDLPGMSGLELARLLREQLPQLALVAVTGRASPADRALGLEVGFRAHLAKPVNPQQLQSALLAILRPQHNRKTSDA